MMCRATPRDLAGPVLLPNILGPACHLWQLLTLRPLNCQAEGYLRAGQGSRTQSQRALLSVESTAAWRAQQHGAHSGMESTAWRAQQHGAHSGMESTAWRAQQHGAHSSMESTAWRAQQRGCTAMQPCPLQAH